MSNDPAPGDWVQLVADRFYGQERPDRGLVAGRRYRVADVVRDRHDVPWVVLVGVARPSWRYPGWAVDRFEVVSPAAW